MSSKRKRENETPLLSPKNAKGHTFFSQQLPKYNTVDQIPLTQPNLMVTQRDPEPTKATVNPEPTNPPPPGIPGIYDPPYDP